MRCKHNNITTITIRNIKQSLKNGNNYFQEFNYSMLIFDNFHNCM